MSKIFISYRREDSGAACSHIYDRLKIRFGKENIFKDVESIPYGVTFQAFVAQKMSECAVALVLIGPQWATVTKGGQRRLDDPSDNVRIEVELALARFLTHEMMVMPVLVQNASMPEEEYFPQSIRLLHKINGPQIHDDPYFDFDIQRLITQLERRLGQGPTVLAPNTSDSVSPFAPAVSVAPTDLNANVGESAIGRVQHATPLIESALEWGDWIEVLERCRVLKSSASEAMPLSLWQTYARACLAEGATREAREALDMAMELAETRRERLEVLRIYAVTLNLMHEWEELLRRAKEGARTTSEVGRWHWYRIQIRALEQLHREGEALALARAITARSDCTADDWLTFARLIHAAVGVGSESRVRSALNTAAQMVPEDYPAIVQAQEELHLPPPDPVYTQTAFDKYKLVNTEPISFLDDPLFALEEPAKGVRLFLFSTDPGRLCDASFACNPTRGMYVIAEGVHVHDGNVSQSFVSAPWARIIAKNFAQQPQAFIDEQSFRGWLEASATQWRDWMTNTWVPAINQWRQERGERPGDWTSDIEDKGAHAKLLGAALLRNGTQLEARILAIGDGRFLVFRRNEASFQLRSVFPENTPDDLNLGAPTLQTLHDPRMVKLAWNKRQARRVPLQSGDVIVLATGSVAKWLLTQAQQVQEQEDKIVGGSIWSAQATQLVDPIMTDWTTLLTTDDQLECERLLRREVAAGRLEEEDSTIVVIPVE